MSTIKSSTEHLTLNADGSGKDLKLQTNGTERMRIDSSGNVLVGKTSTAIENVGINLFGTGRVISTADGDDVAVLNRKTSDGDIAVFKKDGATVGSIDSVNGDLAIGTGITALRFGDSLDALLPHSLVTNAGTNGTQSLGWSSSRFKDLYLSGGVYLGGTGSANHLDDYEEGTFTPTLLFGGGSTGVVYSQQYGFYTKVGNLVSIAIRLVTTSKGTSTGAVTIGGLPFSAPGGSYFASGSGSLNAVSFSGAPGSYIGPSFAYLKLVETSDAGTRSDITNSDCTNGVNTILSINYQAT